MAKLFLIDAYALIFRSYYALLNNTQRNSRGENTSAVYGFFNTFHEVLSRERPTHVAVAFDPAGPTFRHEASPYYKAQRDATPEDIHWSVPHVKALLGALRVPIYECAGFEADDVIGTVAKRAAAEGAEVYMLTPDKDYAQLVEDNIKMYRPRHGGGYDILGPQEVVAKYGLDNPGQMRDYLALVGDKADNIPGCRGIGEKGAPALIRQFGSIEGLLARTAELKGANRTKIESGADDIRESLFLATIRTDVPIDFRLDDTQVQAPDEAELRKLCADLEFRTLADRLLGTPKPKKKGPVQLDLFATLAPAGAEAPKKTEMETLKTNKHHYILAETEEDMGSVFDKLTTCETISLDTETTSTDPNRAELVGLSFAVREGEAYYIAVPAEREAAQRVVEIFRPIYENPATLKVGQNLKYDLEVLRRYGIRLAGRMWDTMIAHYLVQPELRHNMDFMAETLLGYRTVHIDELIGPKGKGQKSMRDLAPAEVYEYACEDADITLRLRNKLLPMVEKEGATELLEQMEMPLMPVLAEMEMEGVRLDTAALADTSRHLTARLAEIEREVHQQAGGEFNIASPKQVGEVLFDRLKLVAKPRKTKTGQYVTSEETLAALAPRHPIVQLILDHRGLKKLLGTYIDALPRLVNPTTGRIHTSFNQAVTATGRLSSSDPNLQNIPIRGDDGKEIRRAFVPEEGCLFFSADYSQIELRVMAHLSGDAAMIEAFRGDADIHRATAAKIYHKAPEEVGRDERSKAKRANFGIIYGITVFGLADRLGITREEARGLIDGYFATFPKVWDYMEQAKRLARERGYVETMYGRRRYLPDINSGNATVRGFAERNAINAPIQGTAADIIKLAMIAIDRRFREEGLRAKMILQVHDELNFSVPKDEKEAVERIVVEQMQGAAKLSVPLIAECGWGDNWLEAH